MFSAGIAGRIIGSRKQSGSRARFLQAQIAQIRAGESGG
jgi:hypothetical protein